MDELRALRAILAVSEERSFSRAARRLGRSQPSISRLVRAYEDHHGIVLFDRTSRLVEPTEAGTALLATAAVAVEHADLAATRGRDAQRGGAGVLLVGFVTGAANVLLDSALPRLAREHPGLEVRLLVMSVEEQIDALVRRQIDVGLVRAPWSSRGGGLVARRIYEAPFVLAESERRAAERDDGPIDIAELADEPLVMWPRSMAPTLYDQLMHHLRVRGLARANVVATSSDTLARLALVAADIGVSLVTYGTASAITRRGVVYRQLHDPPTSEVMAVHREARPTAVDHFVDACLPNA